MSVVESVVVAFKGEVGVGRDFGFYILGFLSLIVIYPMCKIVGKYLVANLGGRKKKLGV